jgi:hypothetical protein
MLVCQRIGIMENKICFCEENYETLDHILWSCLRFEIVRTSSNTEFVIAGVSRTTPIPDLLSIGSRVERFQTFCGELQCSGSDSKH